MGINRILDFLKEMHFEWLLWQPGLVPFIIQGKEMEPGSFSVLALVLLSL